MAIEAVREYMKQWGVQDRILEFEVSSATVELAAQAVELVGHAVGGVCPFAVKPGVEIYLDESLRQFDTVFPAAGSSNSAIEVTMEELERFSGSTNWVDVCKA